MNFSVVTIHRTELMGNIGERVVARWTVRDRGTVMYDWFTGEGLWTSTDVGGLTHQLLIIDGHPTVRFREPGTNTVWLLRCGSGNGPMRIALLSCLVTSF